MWRHSEEKIFLQELYKNKNFLSIWLLGELNTFPYRNPEECSMEEYFNEIHSKARCIVERLIGLLKARWKILSNDSSRHSPVALHNMCIHFKVPNYTQNSMAVTINSETDVGNETQLTKIGQKIRDHIKLSLGRNK